MSRARAARRERRRGVGKDADSSATESRSKGVEGRRGGAFGEAPLGRDRAGVRARPGSARTNGSRGAASARSPTSPTASARPPVPRANVGTSRKMCDTFAARADGSDANAFGIFSLDQSRRVVRDTSARAKKTRRRASRANHPRGRRFETRAARRSRRASRHPPPPGPARGRPRARRALRTRAPPLDVRARFARRRAPASSRALGASGVAFPRRARARGGSRRRLAFEFRARRERQALEGGPLARRDGVPLQDLRAQGQGPAPRVDRGPPRQARGGRGRALEPGRGAPAASRRASARRATRCRVRENDSRRRGRPGEDAPRHAPPAPRARAPASTARAKPDPFDFDASADASVGPETDPEVPASPATRSPAAKSPGSASRRRSPLGLRTSPGGPVRRLLGPKSPGTAFGAARDAPGGGPSRPAAAPEGAPRPAPDADGCVTPPDPFAPTPSKRRRVTFAEVDAYDMAEEDEDAEEPPESPASAPARWGVFGSPGDAEPSDGDRSAGPSAASLGGANGAEASAPSPEWAKRTRVVPNEDASGRGGGGSPMSPDYAGNHPSGTPRRSPGAATTASPPRRGARARAPTKLNPKGPPKGSRRSTRWTAAAAAAAGPRVVVVPFVFATGTRVGWTRRLGWRWLTRRSMPSPAPATAFPSPLGWAPPRSSSPSPRTRRSGARWRLRASSRRCSRRA